MIFTSTLSAASVWRKATAGLCLLIHNVLGLNGNGGIMSMKFGMILDLLCITFVIGVTLSILQDSPGFAFNFAQYTIVQHLHTQRI